MSSRRLATQDQHRQVVGRRGFEGVDDRVGYQPGETVGIEVALLDEGDEVGLAEPHGFAVALDHTVGERDQRVATTLIA